MCFSSQCEENASLADCSRYLKLPFSKANLPSNNQSLKGTKESFWITSFLCSTKLTQNGNDDSLARSGRFSFVVASFFSEKVPAVLAKRAITPPPGGGKGTAFSPAVLERAAALPSL